MGQIKEGTLGADEEDSQQAPVSVLASDHGNPSVEPDIETETMKIASYETATETISAYFSHRNTQIFNEEKLSNSNQAKIEALREQKQTGEQRANNHKLIARALSMHR